MPVTALSPARSGRHLPRATGPGRPTAIRRAAADAPSLTLTLSIPLAGDALTPQAYRLIEAVRELVETSQGTVTMARSRPSTRSRRSRSTTCRRLRPPARRCS